ncbi:MAG: NmrA family NAD(P)-binding protein, partial [Nitriliruptoraceae bacterium]
MTSADTGQPRRVLVTGAGGKTGHAVIAAIRASGGQCRAVVHTSRDVAGAEAVVADQCSVDELVAALDGVDAVYAIAPNLSDAEIVMAEALIEACQRHGVERLVFHSVIHPQLVSMPHHRDKLHAEARLLESGLAVTILQPNVYMQNLAAFRAAMQAATLAVPYATDRPFGMV